MGKVLSLLTRPIRTFNIDNRASRVISREKPERAPLPKKAEEQLKLAQQVNPNFLEKHNKKDSQLDSYLKNVFVTSTDPKIPEMDKETKSEKLLPQSRALVPDFEYGYCEPVHIQKGKCSLRQVVEFLVQHSADPKTYTIEYIAEHYELDKEVVKFMLQYYKIHHVITPDNKDTPLTELLLGDLNFLTEMKK